MTSVLKAAWRVVARRAVTDRAIIGAAFLTVLLAITLLAAGPIYADAVTVSSLHRTLADADVQDANVAVSTRVEATTFENDDETVLAALTETFAATGAEVFRRGTSDSYTPTDLPGDHSSDIVLFRFFTELADRIEVLEGSMPGPGGATVQVAIPETVAKELDLETGSEFEVQSRAFADQRLTVRVTGIYRIADASDPYWFGDELDTNGMAEGAAFRTLGPLIVTPQTYFGTVATASSSMRWIAVPHHENLQVDQIASEVRHLEALEEDLNAGRLLGNQMQVATGLEPLLADTQRSLLVTRSAVMVVTVQLVILAGYALFLTAGLLADSRQIETTTLRSRGAGNSQLIGMATMEGAMVAIPAWALGPLLASLLLLGFNRIGPLAGIGLGIDPAVGVASWWLAGLAAVAAVAGMVIPAARSARQFGSVRATRSRQSKLGVAGRAGLDVALLAIAAIGIWQLARYRSTLTRTAAGTLGVDPLLVTAPAIALLAGAVLALRALPLLAHIAERAVARGKSLVPSLGLWQLSRQPRRYARSALLLMLAVAIGFFTLAYDATWQQSQRDQADFQVGADLRVVPATQVGSIPAQYRWDAYRRLDGEVAPVPVVTASGRMTGATLPIEYLAVDAARAPDTVLMREDLAALPLSDLMQALSDSRSTIPGLTLEGEPVAFSATVTATAESSDSSPLDASVRLVMVDDEGLAFRVGLGHIDQSGQPVRLSGALGFAWEGGAPLGPAYPLRLNGLEILSMSPRAPNEVGVRIELTGLSYLNENGWVSVDLTAAETLRDPLTSQLREPFANPAISVTTTEESLVADFRSGSTTNQYDQPVYVLFPFAESATPDPLPVLAPKALVEELGLGIGEMLPLNGLPQYPGNGIIVGMFDAFPTVRPDEAHALVLDYQTYVAATLGPGVFPNEPSLYWMSADEGVVTAVADQLTTEPYESASVETRSDRSTVLALDPVSLGTIGALLMGLLAAVALAVIGFLVNVTVSTKERIIQFALMRAIGLSTGQLVRWVTIENGVVVSFGLASGIGLGWLLSSLVLPLITVTQDATTVMPSLAVVYPWSTIALMVGLLLAAVIVGGVIVSRALRHLDTASLLRMGGE